MIAIVGAGGIGANTALFLRKALPRAQITIIDRDYVDEGALKRQLLYKKGDLGKPKVLAAAEKLGARGIFENLDAKNAGRLLKSSKIILDCTDSWQARAVINNYCLETGTPWIFSSAIRSEAMLSTVTPETPCWLCWNPEPKTPRSCSSEGITLRATTTIARAQVAEAARLLKGKPKYAGKLLYIDTGTGFKTVKQLKRNPECGACVLRLGPASQPITVCSEHEHLFIFKKKPDLSRYRLSKLGPAIRFKTEGATATLIGDKLFIKGVERKRAELIFNRLA